MSDDVLTTESEWPELSELEGFWDDDDPTPPRGVPVIDVHADDDDPTPVNAPRPVPQPTLPPPTSAPVAGPAPTALIGTNAEPVAVALPTGPHAPPAATRPARRGRRRIVAGLTVAGLAGAGWLGWQWNEGRHDAASAPRVLPAEVAAPELDGVVELEVDRVVDVRVWADLDSGDAVAQVAGRYWLATTSDGYLTRDAQADEWTLATPALLDANGDVVDLLDEPTPVVFTDVLPADVHPYIDIADDRIVDAAVAVANGTTVFDVGRDDAVRMLTLRVDRTRLTDDQPLRARLLGLSGDEPLEMTVWVDHTGLIHRLSTSAGTTTIGGGYALVAIDPETPEPLDGLALGPDGEAVESVVDDAPPSTAGG